MKITVIGAGGIGGYVGGRLAEQGHDVALIARGAHLQALQASGLTLRLDGDEVRLPDIKAFGSAAEAGPADLVLFCVKLPDTDAAAQGLAPAIQGNTRIVTLQNGIDGKRLIAAHADAERISAGTIFLASYIREPGVIEALPGIRLITVDALGGDPVIAGFVEAINRTGTLEAAASDESDRVLWTKFAPLSAFSGITALTRLPLGLLRADPEKREFFLQLLNESIAVARACGLDLGAEVTERALHVFNTQSDDMKSSLLVDIEAGKPCEIAYLSGRIHRLGREHGVPTPGHSAVWVALSAYENGKPDVTGP